MSENAGKVGQEEYDAYATRSRADTEWSEGVWEHASGDTMRVRRCDWISNGLYGEVYWLGTNQYGDIIPLGGNGSEATANWKAL
jgi:hypothetical protein